MDPRLSEFELAQRDWPQLTDVGHARRAAARVIDELAIAAPPIDVEIVASMRDIHAITQVDGLDAAGMLITTQAGRLEIQVRASDPATRQRFTVAHELGHTLFPGYRMAARYRCQPSAVATSAERLEQLCDTAASEFLMPTQLLRPILDDQRLELDLVEMIADQFDVSLLAASSAVTEHVVGEHMMIVLEEMQKPTQHGSRAAPQLRVKYHLRNGRWPFIPKHKSVNPLGLFGRAAAGEYVHERATLAELCDDHTTVEIEARPYHRIDDHGTVVPRVLACVRRPN